MKIATIALAASLHFINAQSRADVFHVPADYPTIQDAVGPAGNGDEIVIAPGTYAPFTIGAENITFRGSGGPEVTIIDGGGTNVCVFSAANGLGTFEDLTFTNGSGTTGGAVAFGFGSGNLSFNNCIFSNNANSAVGSPNAVSTLVFTGCTFIGNSGSSGGAARTGTSDFEFIDCNFLNNTATTLGGALYINNSSGITITGCTFQGNSAPYGGAICNFNPFTGPNEQLDDSVFDGNTATDVNGGGAIWTAHNTPISNCQFIGNIAQTGPGGAVHCIGINAVATLTNCTFDQNEATIGGGVATGSGSATDCTFTANIASGSGGALHGASDEFTVTSCTMSGNSAGTSGGAVYVADGAIVHVNDSTLCMNIPDQFDYVGAFLATNVFGCDVTCPNVEPVGACCFPRGDCVAITQKQCIAAGGAYQGDGTDCGTANCPQPTCEADIAPPGGDGVVNVDDLLKTINFWGACP